MADMMLRLWIESKEWLNSDVFLQFVLDNLWILLDVRFKDLMGNINISAGVMIQLPTQHWKRRS